MRNTLVATLFALGFGANVSGGGGTPTSTMASGIDRAAKISSPIMVAGRPCKWVRVCNGDGSNCRWVCH
jgi:hypothetical protein